MDPETEKFVSRVFYENRQIVLTPEVSEMFRQLLTIENGRDTLESTGTEYAVYENVPLANLLHSIMNFLDNVLVSTVMKEAKVFSCLYDLWFYFDSKLNCLYQRLYMINNVAPLNRLIIGNGDLTLSTDMFIDYVIHNSDVTNKLKLKAEDRENLDEKEIKYFKLVVQKLKLFQHERSNAEILQFLEKNLPTNSMF